MNRYIDGLSSPHRIFREEADRLAAQFDADTAVDAAGVVRWNSNNRVPPGDILEFWAHMGKPFNLAASQAARDEETSRFIEEYRRNYKGPSAEQRAEARAAHGPGVELVDVITGHRWRT